MLYFFFVFLNNFFFEELWLYISIFEKVLGKRVFKLNWWFNRVLIELFNVVIVIKL